MLAQGLCTPSPCSITASAITSLHISPLHAGFSRFMVNTATEQHTGYHAPFLNNNIDALTIQHGYHIEATHTSTQEECRHNEHSDSNDQGATGDRGSDFACRGLGGVHLQRVPAFLSPNAARHSSLRLLQGLEHYTRVFNNLIEKLHHANFFYVLVDHNTFTLINNYFIAGVLVFLPLMLSFFQLVFLHHHRFTACDVLSSLSVLAGIYCGLGWCCVLVCPLLATIAQPSTAFASTSISLPSSSSWLEVGNEMLAIITSVISHAVATTASLLNVPPGVMEETLAFSPPSFVSPMTALLALPPSPFSFPLSLLSMLTSSFSPPSPSSSNPSSLISASSAASLSSAFQERAASLSPLLSWVLGLALLSGLVLTVLQVLVCRRLCWYQLPKFWSTYTIIGSEKEVGRIEEESEYTRGKEIVTKGEPEGGQKRGKESDRGEDKTNENIMGVKKEQNSGTHESEAKYNCTYPPTVSATPASSTTPVPMPALRTFDWRCLKAMVMFMLLIVFGALMFFSFQLAIITMSALVPLVLVAAPLSKYCVCRAVPSSPLSSPSSPPTQPRITHHIVSMLFAWICGILTCTLLILLSPPALLVLYAHANALGLISAVHEVCVLLATSSKLAVLVLWFLYLPVYFVSLLITLAPVSVDVKHTMSKQ